MNQELETIIQYVPLATMAFSAGVVVPTLVYGVTSYMDNRRQQKESRAFAETFLELSKIRHPELYKNR